MSGELKDFPHGKRSLRIAVWLEMRVGGQDTILETISQGSVPEIRILKQRLKIFKLSLLHPAATRALAHSLRFVFFPLAFMFFLSSMLETFHASLMHSFKSK